MDAGKLFGRGLSFPPRVGADGRMQWSEGEQNINEAIYIVLMTRLNERINLPVFGSNLGTLLFEPNTVETRHLISTEISEALARWEPRIAVESVVVDPDPQDAEAVIATLNYRLISTQARQSASFNIPLTG